MRYLLLFAPALLLAAPARYARVGEMAGSVETQVGAADAWIAAERNAPLPQTARARTGPASRLEIEFDEGSVLRLGPNSQAELSDYTRLATGQRVTLVAIDRGVVYLTGSPEGRDSLVLALPGAHVSLSRDARVRVEVEQQWSQIAVLSGAARFSSPSAEMELRAGQTTRVEPANPARFFFYKEVLPADLDEWVEQRDEALKSPSAAHVIQRYGLADLDGTGEWILTPDLGAVWRPKVEGDWRPYRDGRWRWYDALGYTWVSDEPWGWLPYHYGRWTRLDNLGWIWAPSKNGVFKPAEVYWMRGAKFVGWGPLAPGEQWDPMDEVNPIPQEFLDANTTYAKFSPGAIAIDPLGFQGKPKDPLKEGDFLAALPSPAFVASRLDAARPIVNAASLRVKPVMDGPAIETAPPQPRPTAPPPRPVVIVTQAPAQPPPPPEVVEVPVAVPAGVVYVTPARATRSVPPAVSPSRGSRKYRNAREEKLVAAIVQKLEAKAFDKALIDLDEWSASFPDSEFAADRTYYYMLAFNGLEQPAKVVARSATLLMRPIRDSFPEPMQALSVVYLVTTNYLKLTRPGRDQSAIAASAARAMLSLLPSCFAGDGAPQGMTPAEWAKSRSELETIARDTLARAHR